MGGVVVSVLAQRIPKHMQGLELGEKAHEASFLFVSESQHGSSRVIALHLRP
jgi:hypothetical protein